MILAVSNSWVQPEIIVMFPSFSIFSTYIYIGGQHMQSQLRLSTRQPMNEFIFHFWRSHRDSSAADAASVDTLWSPHLHVKWYLTKPTPPWEIGNIGRRAPQLDAAGTQFMLNLLSALYIASHLHIVPAFNSQQRKKNCCYYYLDYTHHFCRRMHSAPKVANSFVNMSCLGIRKFTEGL